MRLCAVFLSEYTCIITASPILSMNMKGTLRLSLAFVVILMCTVNTFSQTQCAVVGWASQNGGVTGGGTATPTVVTNYNDLKAAITSASVKVVHISGTITIPAGGRISFQDQSAKTIFGLPGSRLVSNDLTKDGSGIMYVKRCSNVILRNVTFEGPGAYDTDGWDNITFDASTNIWIDHCEFQDGMDGNLDIKNAADYITVTWCKFIYNKTPIPDGPGGSDDHRFSNLFGSSDGATGDRGKLRVTMQNCWWAEGCKERMPRVRFGKVHIVNNLFNSTVANKNVMAGFEADLLIESNVFENSKSPIDLMDKTFTAITSRSNIFTNTSGNMAGSGTAFTPPYTLTITPAADVKALVTASAGATLTSNGCDTTTPTTYTLSTTASPAAGGTVTGAGTYNTGTAVTLTATPATGYTFAGWSGDASGTAASISVSLTANKSVTASFRAQATTTYTLTTTATPSVGGTVSGAGTYDAGTVVSVTATPASGYTFTGWSGDASGTTNPVVITLSSNTTVTATFQQDSSGDLTTIRIEDDATTAQGLCSYEGSISSNSGATNSKVVNLSNAAGKGVEWKVTAPQAGTYTLNWRYVNSSSNNAYVMALLVNGITLNSALPFAKTTSSSVFAYATTTVSLNAGTNTIRLQSTTSAATADIDWIEITGSTPTPANCTAATTTEASGRSAVAYEESAEQTAAALYPNPASETTTLTVTLHQGEQASVIIYDAQGHKVDNLSIIAPANGGTLQIPYNLASKKAGLYHVLIISNQGLKFTSKLLIE